MAVDHYHVCLLHLFDSEHTLDKGLIIYFDHALLLF